MQLPCVNLIVNNVYGFSCYRFHPVPALVSSSQGHFSNGMEQNVFLANCLNVAFTFRPHLTSRFDNSEDRCVPHTHSNWLLLTFLIIIL